MDQVKTIVGMNNVDLRLKLLAGDTFNISDVKVKPLMLREIKDITYTKYQQYLNILVIKMADLIGSEDLEKVKHLSTMDVILSSGNEEIVSLFVEALLLFTGETEIDYLPSKGILLGFNKIITSAVFKEIVEVIRYQNCIQSANRDVYNPANEMVRDMIEQMERDKQTVQRIKAQNGEGSNIDFADIVSSVSTKSNTYNKSNVWDCTIYQLYDEYKRLELITGYETSILALVNGAQIDNLKHWSSKIED